MTSDDGRVSGDSATKARYELQHQCCHTKEPVRGAIALWINDFGQARLVSFHGNERSREVPSFHLTLTVVSDSGV